MLYVLLKKPLLKYLIKRDKEGRPLCRKCGNWIMSSSRGWCQWCENENWGNIVKIEKRKNKTITIEKTISDKGMVAYYPICQICKVSPCKHMTRNGVFDADKLWEEMKDDR